MPNPGCNTLVLDESKYSSPMPLIGLYIAAGSSACFLAIFLDVLSAVRRKKRWIPCRFFSLNSVTLTLLGIAGKLPVDLTSAMPSTLDQALGMPPKIDFLNLALDQFSKLTGMAFICISMGFLVPSLGMSQKSECISNLIALTILVVTVIVNICIQIHTRAVLLFVTEHTITMICMLGVLIVSWGGFLTITSHKSYSLDFNKDVVRQAEGSMLERLKLAYLYGFDSNPQFVLCKNDESLTAGLCTLCSVVLVQAAFRNLGLDFCRGKSDYDWSMWVIVAVQTLTILVGCLAICCRLMTSSVHMNGQSSVHMIGQNFKMMEVHPIFEIVITPGLQLSRKARCGIFLITVALIGGFFVYVSLAVMLQVALKVARFLTAPFLKTKYKDNEEIKDYRHLIHHNDKGLEEWVLVRGVREMKTWTDSRRSSSSNLLLKLLSETVPHPASRHLPVSPFSMVLLTRIAQACIPPEYSAQPLLQAYGEAREILHFIEDRTKSKSLDNIRASEFAKALWRGKGFSIIYTDNEMLADEDPLEFALSNIKDIEGLFDMLEHADISTSIMNKNLGKVHANLWKEIFDVANFLTSREYTSVEDLTMQIQQEFVYMLHSILSQLPHAIYKEIVESSAEDFHQSVRLCLGIMCKLEPLHSHIRWSFPVESRISQLWPELTGHSQSETGMVQGISQPWPESPVAIPGESQSETHVVDISISSGVISSNS